jgi:hypothetical protein
MNDLVNSVSEHGRVSYAKSCLGNGGRLFIKAVGQNKGLSAQFRKKKR